MSKIPTRKERIEERDKLNRILGSSPQKVWYEIVTNIPVTCNKVVFDLTIKDSLLKVIYKQDIFGPSKEDLSKNMVNKSTTKNGKVNVFEKENSSSVFGTGFTTIGDYCSSQIIESTPENGESFKKDLLTDIEEEIQPLKEYKFIQTLQIPYDNKMGGWKNFIQKLRNIISEVDGVNIQNGRKYKFNVSGLSTTTDCLELSEVIQPKITMWVDELGVPTVGPKLTGYETEKGVETKLVVNAPNVNKKDSSITLDITAIGKRPKEFVLEGFSGDKPMIIVRYKGTNQLCFVMPLRKGNGETSINNVIVEAEVSKSEIATYLESTDKSTGVSDILKNSIFETLRPSILKTYPDTNLVEKMSQLFVAMMIIEDFGGKKLCDMFRSENGLGSMNTMTVAERQKIVKLEKSKSNSRYDIIVWKIWETKGQLTSKTPKWLAENKRQDFGRNDRNQIFSYAVKDRYITSAVGISVDVSQKSIESFEEDIDSIKRAERLNDVEFFPLIDVNDWGFNSPQNFKYFLELAQQEIE
jgi:hypothetical protein